MGAVSPARDWRRLERWLVILIALHSYAVGVMLAAVPEWTLGFAGFGAVEPLFFVRQAGVFHLVAATGYLLEYRQRRGVSLMLFAKTTAVVFLLVASPWGIAWSVPFSGVADGLMGVAVLVVRRQGR